MEARFGTLGCDTFHGFALRFPRPSVMWFMNKLSLHRTYVCFVLHEIGFVCEAELGCNAVRVCPFRTLVRGAAKSSAFQRAQESCIPARYRIDPNFRKTYLVIQVGNRCGARAHNKILVVISWPGVIT